MKIFKRLVLRFIGGFIGLLLLIVLIVSGVVFWVLKNPKDAWHLAEKKFFPEDLRITWQEIHFEANHHSGLNFDVDFYVAGLSIVKGKPLLNIPVKNVHLQAILFPKNSDMKFILQEVQIDAPSTLDIRFEKPAQKEPEKNFYQTAENIFAKAEKFRKWAAIENIDINVAKLRFASGDGKPIVLSFKAHQKKASELGELIHITSDLDLPEEKPIELKITADLKFPALGTEKPFLSGKLHVHGGGISTEQTFSLITANETTRVSSEGQVDYVKEKIHILLHPELDVSLTPTQAVTRLNASFSGLPGPLVKVDHFKLEIKTPLDKDILWSEKPSQFTASAPISLFFIDANMRKPLEKSCECKIPEVLKFELKGRAWLADLFTQPPEAKPLLDSQLSIESVHNKLLSVDIAAKIKIDKKINQYILNPALDVEASINSFQGLVHFLDAKNILIPAPLNLLEGTIKISSHDLVKTSDQGYSLPVTVITALTSKRQVVSLATDTTVKMNSDFKEMFIDVVAKIADLQLELPPLDPMKGKPRVTLDQRILKAPAPPKPKPSKFKVYLSIAAETTKPAAIRLLSGYFQPWLPITLSLHRSKEKDNTGFIKTEPFQIEYLRRKVQVEKMRIDLPDAETKPIPVDARFKIQQTQYTVFIDVTGPINKPEIRLTSEPYLPESEIISVLLYDRVSSELAGSDAETAGNVQAAMADRAIGLFGLWAFAATPIKSFSYNAVTHVYTATVALTDDVTAGIGTNWEEATRLELRKRVSKSWMLTAAWVPATQNEDQKTNLVLQWEKRF